MRTLVFCVFSAAFLGGCPHPPEPTNVVNESADPTTDSDADARPFSEEEKAQSKGKLGGVWSSCYRAYQPQGDPSSDLAHLTAICARSTGFSPVTNVFNGEAQSEKDAAERLTFRARAGRCYRLFAVGDASVGDLDLAIVEGSGKLVAADLSHDRWPVVPPRGPLCFDHEGVYAIEVAVVQGSGRYLLQVWGDETPATKAP